MVDILRSKGYSKFNRAFLNWISSGSITNTNYLLDINEFLEQHKRFLNEYKTSISNGINSITYDKVEYDLNINYSDEMCLVDET